MLCQSTRISAQILLASTLLSLFVPSEASEPLLKIYSRQGDLSEPIWAIPANKNASDPAVLYRSTDGGQTWEVTNPLPSRTAQPAPITTMSSVKTAWDSIYVMVGTDGDGIFRTTDLGDNWRHWNDANVGIITIDGGDRSTYLGSLTSDGATFLTPNSGNEWHQLHDAPLSVTALTQDGSTTTVGTSAGEIIEIDNSYFVVTDLTSSPDGLIVPLPGTVLELVNDTRALLMAIVEHADGSRKLYNGSGVSSGAPWVMQEVGGSTEQIANIAGTSSSFVAVISEDPNPVLYVSSDSGATWTKASLPVSGGINDLDSAYCSSYGCFPVLFLATDAGGFLSEDWGESWVALADTAAAGPLTGTIADSDLSIEMVSPKWGTTQVSKNTSRFEIRVKNNGPENVTDIKVTLEFTTWRDGSNFGSSSWGTSATIDGGECEKGYDDYSSPVWICTLSGLESNSSADLVLIHGLPADGWSMRLVASVDADKLRDSFSGNNAVEFSPMIRETTESAGSGGGGGAVGLFGLFMLLGVVGFLRGTPFSKEMPA